MVDEKPKSLFRHQRKLGNFKNTVNGVKVKYFAFQNINLVISNNFIAPWLLAKARCACSPFEHCINEIEGCVLYTMHVLQHFESLAGNPCGAEGKKEAKSSPVFKNQKYFPEVRYEINCLWENDCNAASVFSDRGICLKHSDIKNKSALTSIIKC